MREDDDRSLSGESTFEDVLRFVVKANFNSFQPRDERGRWAIERDKVWHIARAPDTADIMTISRTTGQRLSPLP